MATFLKAFSADNNRPPVWSIATAPFKRSAGWINWMISSKWLADSGTRWHFRLGHCRTSFQCPGAGDQARGVATEVTKQEEWPQRWGCKRVGRDLVGEASRPCKFGRVFRGLVVSACCVLVIRGKMSYPKAGVVMVTMIFSSKIPKSNGESADDGNVRSLTASDENSNSSDDLDSVASELQCSDGTIHSSSVDTIDSGSIDTVDPSSDATDRGSDSGQLGPDSEQLDPDSQHLGSDSQPYFSSEGVQDSGTDDKLNFNGFPPEIQGRVLGYLPYEQVFQLKTVSKAVKTLAESDEFQASPSRKKVTLTSCYFFIADGVWKWAGYDASAKEWRVLPPLTFLPADCKPDPDLFKEFLVCAKEGLVCINFSKLADRERLIVFNPLSQVWKELPPLNHRRNPVLMHLLVDPVTMAYQVIVAGSSKPGDERLSHVTEVFDSCTGTWTRTGDIPGPPYALNEFQSGVHQNGKIICIGFVKLNGKVGKGIIAYDVKAAKWSATWMYPLPKFYMSSTILQLVGNNGEVYLFSEREIGQPLIEHRIDRVEWSSGPLEEDETKCECELVNVIQTKKTGGKSLEVYPEHVIVPYANGQLCVMNAIAHTGIVYDVRDQEKTEFRLEAPAEDALRGELNLFTLNPMSFTVEPKFSSKVRASPTALSNSHGNCNQRIAGPRRPSNPVYRNLLAEFVLLATYWLLSCDEISFVYFKKNVKC